LNAVFPSKLWHFPDIDNNHVGFSGILLSDFPQDRSNLPAGDAFIRPEIRENRSPALQGFY
jgi:hypothetical protein